MSEKYQSQLHILANDDRKKQLGIDIEALPMYNLPESADDAKHVKGRGNGYLLEMGKKKVYISGDTAGIDRNAEVCNRM